MSIKTPPVTSALMPEVMPKIILAIIGGIIFAIAVFEDPLPRANPNDWQSYEMRGDHFFSGRHYQFAIRELDQAIEILGNETPQTDIQKMTIKFIFIRGELASKLVFANLGEMKDNPQKLITILLLITSKL